MVSSGGVDGILNDIYSKVKMIETHSKGREIHVSEAEVEAIKTQLDNLPTGVAPAKVERIRNLLSSLSKKEGPARNLIATLITTFEQKFPIRQENGRVKRKEKLDESMENE